MVGAPLEWGGKLVGAIALGSLDRRAIGPEDRSFVSAITRPLANAIGNARLYEQAREADEQRRRLLSRLVRAQEEERLRIAGDIHDDSIQVMTATGMRLEVLRRRLGENEYEDEVRRIQETVTEAVGRLRSLMFQLRPPALDREGLAAALRLHLEQMLSAPYTLDNRIEEEPDPETRVVLYRIAQEALTNVRKHARASHVGIRLETRERGILVTIADDGVGFLPEEKAITQPGHLGLVSMRERAEMAGGWLRIDSAPGQGTTVRFWAPASP